MKTPDEIKKGLECCCYDADTGEKSCEVCPYFRSACEQELQKDALAYIQQLERERDEAIKTLKQIGDCKYCKHDGICTDRFPNCVECENTNCACHTCTYRSNWQWRGVQ